MGKVDLMKAQGEYQKAQGDAMANNPSPADDQDLDSARHDRGYNPLDQAERASISQKLNEDAGRYKKGPGPF